MNEEASVRVAVISDIPAIHALYKILFAEMSQLQPGVWRPAEMPRSFIAELVAGERSNILLIEEGGEIAGFAVVQDRDTPPLNCLHKNRFCYLLDFVVQPNRRGKGLGKALLAAAEAWAHERNLKWLELNVLAENTGAIKLYEKTGMKPSGYTMRKMYT
ncbi:MAG: GNAT family N-acetyltransferase [Oscillospiraceae bacterium]|nr:GNAT family N-acetyltransferase [Oscillospiraceae bacterium]